MRFTPTNPGLVGKILTGSDPLADSICPECPWRKEMTPGYSIAMAADYSMMEVALTRKNHETLKRKIPDLKVPFVKLVKGTPVEDGRQCCHMRTEQRCRGAEAFRANVGLPSEAPRSEKIFASEDAAIKGWRARGSGV